MGNGVSALHTAAMQGDLKALRIAVQEQPSALDAAEPVNGYTALHIAASKGFDALVRELLARNAAPNIKAKDGRSALHLAAAGGHADVIQALLRRGADPGATDGAGKAPLDYAPPGTPAAALLQQALYLGWVPSPGGSPTKAQAAARQQGTAFPPAAPPLTGGTADTLGLPRWPPGPPAAAAAAPPLGAATTGGTAPAYLAATTDSWLSDLPVPPAGGDAPSAPPPPPTAVPFINPAAAGGAGAGGAGGPAAVPDYYSYIIPAAQREALLQQKEQDRQRAAAATAAAAGGAGLGGGGLYPSLPTPGAGGGSAYPSVPSAVSAPAVGPSVSPPAVTSHPVVLGAAPAGAAAAAGVAGGGAGAGRGAPRTIAEEEEEDDWGASVDEDDWGDESISAARRSTGAAAGPSGRTNAAPDPNPLAVAGKIGSAVAGAAAAGARMVLTSILQGGPGGGGRGAGAAARREGPLVDEEGATASGPVGRTYTRQQLAAATQNFSPANRIGAGGFGPVYRGVLDGVPVAVKALDRSSGAMQGEAEFYSEVQILSRLHHPHIVLLLGSCPAECMLVYELLEGGTLEEHLFAPGFPPLAWQDRVRIAAEVAAALVFLHSAPTPVVHMDLKPGNILLNRQLTSKLGDVGLSRLVPSLAAAAAAAPGGAGGRGVLTPPVSTVLDTRLVGTPAYMDPEYLRSGRFGPKSDTYSLGIILLQLLTGQPAQAVVGVMEAALAAWHTRPAALGAVLDPRAGAWPLTEASPLALMAMKCCSLERSQRPDLREEVLPRLLTLAQHAQAAALADAAAAAGRPGGPVRSSSRRGGADQPPAEFICPITQDIMEDPVVAADGYTYERDAIAGWLAKSGRSPMTNETLASPALIPNHTLRSAIKEWLQRHPGAAP